MAPEHGRLAGRRIEPAARDRTDRRHFECFRRCQRRRDPAGAAPASICRHPAGPAAAASDRRRRNLQRAARLRLTADIGQVFERRGRVGFRQVRIDPTIVPRCRATAHLQVLCGEPCRRRRTSRRCRFPAPAARPAWAAFNAAGSVPARRESRRSRTARRESRTRAGIPAGSVPDAARMPGAIARSGEELGDRRAPDCR